MSNEKSGLEKFKLNYTSRVQKKIEEVFNFYGKNSCGLIEPMKYSSLNGGKYISANKAIDFAGVIMKHPLTDEIWMRVNSKSNPISQISASIDSAITAVNDLKNIASKIK